MPQGSIFVTVRAAESAFPVESATIIITTPEGVELGRDQVSADNGSVSREFFIDAPDPALSLSPQESALPYSTCDATVIAPGFITVRVKGIQIFAGEKSELPLEMMPQGREDNEVNEYVIGPHALTTVPDISVRQRPDEDERILTRVFIPERITVHLGPPDAYASNVTVPFVDYIKNVASSEVYPTWPERSLRANILCQISLALNRIFTEWYPSRGYNFNITNSTAYDQYFVYGRNIFDNISRIVDEIFNRYIRRPGRIDPFYAEYCNGSTVTCPGLSQWGTVSLANNGLSVEEILQFYYGDVEVVQTNEIRGIESSYPGSPLSLGSSGNSVRIIQQQLNRIRINYPSIPAISSVDGVFGAQTQAAVRTFQSIFNLTQDGIVGKSTWYRISFIYTAVKKLAELNSEGERPVYDDNSFPGILRFGDTGTGVQTLQFYLKNIAAFNPFIPDIAIDGIFGRSTENVVRAFQSYYGLFVDGVVGENTWNEIVRVYLNITEGGSITIEPYPGFLLRVGSQGEEVLYVQKLLNRIRPVFATIPSLAEDGIYGSRVQRAVREFQRIFGLSTDGVVGRDTWNALNRVFGSIASGCLDNGPTQTGRVLRYGSAGADVRGLQSSLNLVGQAISPIPRVSVDGQYGRATEEAVRIFQRLLGLTADGVVGNATRTRLTALVRAVENGCLPTSGSFNIAASPEQPLSASPDQNQEVPVFQEIQETLETQDTSNTGLWPASCPWRDEKAWERRNFSDREERERWDR